MECMFNDNYCLMLVVGKLCVDKRPQLVHYRTGSLQQLQCNMTAAKLLAPTDLGIRVSGE